MVKKSKIEDNELKEYIIDKFICFVCLKEVKDPLICTNEKCSRLICQECFPKGDGTIICACGTQLSSKNCRRVSFINKVVSYIKEERKNSLKVDEIKKNKICKIHKNDFIKHYCHDCKIEICGTCSLINHKGHKIISNEEYNLLTKKFEYLNDSIDYLENKKKQYIDNIEYYNKLFEILKEAFIQNLEENINEINKILDIAQNYKKLIDPKKINTNNYNILNDDISKIIGELNDDNLKYYTKRIDLEKKLANFNSEKNTIFKGYKFVNDELIESLNNHYLSNVVYNHYIGYENEEDDLKSEEGFVDEDDIFNGYYTEYDNEEMTYTIENCLNGKGVGAWKKYCMKGKLIYSGIQENDRIKNVKEFDENGKLIYEGEFDGVNYNGFGKLILDNGDIYLGEFYDGKRHGKGIYFYKNESEREAFVGNFKNNKKNGEGIFYYKNYNTYIVNYDKDGTLRKPANKIKWI